VSRAIVTAALVACTLTLLASAASAVQVTLLEGALQVVIQSSAGVLPIEQGVAVREEITLKALPPGNSLTVMYLDDRPALFSNDPQPRLRLDTRQLSDGPHRLKVDSTGLDGIKLASAADLVLHVANAPGALAEQIGATVSQSAPVFLKLYRKYIPREVVWFNGREGDLEKHGFRKYGQIYLTATDLFRHIGGTIVWGPTQNWIELHRNDVVVRIIPGTSKIVVNGQVQNLGAPCPRKADRTYVPVQALCAVLGIPTAWNAEEQRLYVTFQR